MGGFTLIREPASIVVGRNAGIEKKGTEGFFLGRF